MSNNRERDARLACRWSIAGNPDFGTDGNAMLSLLDAVTKDGCRFEINNLGRDKRVICCIELSTTIGDYVEAEADTLPEAVAAAADMIPERPSV